MEPQKIFKAGVVQFDIINGQIETNMELVFATLGDLASQNVRLAVLPELFSCGFDNRHLKAHSRHTASILERLSGFARAHGMAIAGSLPESANGQVYNTMYFVDTNGSVRETYRKLHLFRLTNEHLFYGAGDKAVTIDTSLGRMGLMICYDLRFPELARKLFLAGAEMILVSAQWPSPRKHHWHHLAVARAIESQLYMVCANRTGTDESLAFPGMSMIVDPLGEIIADAGAFNGTAVAPIEMERVAQARQMIPCLTDRRADIYGQ
ncbi:MAG: carbon-nitrogen family hydrolase [Proteobacteria bacterium]|nr:carbon-nitrogen family hydrolase [Desulfobacula sp.]MBU3950521.1 carbon-nitrogen family hydrolase [Pseudomonadota bacterium]MBU4132955.1 carbon-nitrogen family hydrolase [Pseudomonadota bacterium]